MPLATISLVGILVILAIVIAVVWIVGAIRH
jgi:hypothetical protein